jgi:hypothetical protein
MWHRVVTLCNNMDKNGSIITSIIPALAWAASVQGAQMPCLGSAGRRWWQHMQSKHPTAAATLKRCSPGG